MHFRIISACTLCPPGAGVGEGDAYQRVNVDDGSTAVGTVDHLVHQTVTPSLHLWSGYGPPAEGNLY